MSAFIDLIQAAEREIRRDSEDLTRLKKRYPGYDFVLVKKNAHELAQNAARAQLGPLQTAILGLIASSSPSYEWTSRTVLTALTASGQASFASEEVAMNGVAIALAALKDAGRIQRVHEGRGRDPHRYKALEKEVPSEEKTS